MVRHLSVLFWLAVLSLAPATAQSTRRISVDPSGGPANGDSGVPSISDDGRYIGFASDASNLVPGDTNGVTDAFVRDRQTGLTERISMGSTGTEGNDISYDVHVSADGRCVAFSSAATNLVPGDTNHVTDVFVHDRQTGQTTRVSVDSFGTQGDALSSSSSISSDGRYVAFVSSATNLAAFDTNGFYDVFVHDRSTGATRRVSVDSTGVQCNRPSYFASISGNGGFVAFASTASNLVANDTNASIDVFVHDLLAASTQRVSVNSAGAQANDGSTWPSISFDGRFVAFISGASSLVQGDTNGHGDVFVHDLQTGATERVSVASNGAQGNDDSGVTTSISPDGRYVAFGSRATNLIAGDSNGKSDVFVHDRLTGVTTRESVSTSGAAANEDSSWAFLSAGARFMVFQTPATNLVPNDTSYYDVFLRDRSASSAFATMCFGDGSAASCPCSNDGASGHGCASSAVSSGALLSASGAASLSNDSALLTSSGEPASALSVVLQGSDAVAPTIFGGGLRCAGGLLLRPYTKNASGGTMSAPQGSEQPISVRSAALGDPISLGSTRIYQVYYRDSNLAFCPAGFNVSNAVAIAWGS